MNVMADSPSRSSIRRRLALVIGAISVLVAVVALGTGATYWYAFEHRVFSVRQFRSLTARNVHEGSTRAEVEAFLHDTAQRRPKGADVQVGTLGKAGSWTTARIGDCQRMLSEFFTADDLIIGASVKEDDGVLYSGGDLGRNYWAFFVFDESGSTLQRYAIIDGDICT